MLLSTKQRLYYLAEVKSLDDKFVQMQFLYLEKPILY